MASTAAEYRKSSASATQKSSELQPLSRRAFQRQIALQMVRRISRALAIYHVSSMSYDELEFRARMYARLEKGAVAVPSPENTNGADRMIVQIPIDAARVSGPLNHGKPDNKLHQCGSRV
jgi:hypothetical protein